MRNILIILVLNMAASIHGTAPGSVQDTSLKCRTSFVHRLRNKGIGGSGGVSAGFMHLDMAPIKELVVRENDLSDKTFDLSDNSIFMFGGQGYVGPGKGVRIGGGGWVGMKNYTSAPYTPLQDSSSISGDSVVQLKVILPYGGLTVEKCYVLRNMNIFVGGLLGGGAMVVQKTLYQADAASAFRHYDNSDYDDEEHDDFIDEFAAMPFLAADLRAGITYSMASFMHLGFEGYALLIYSSDSFGYGYSSVATINPGIRARLVFGTLG
jgi:hypothetical protein